VRLFRAGTFSRPLSQIVVVFLALALYRLLGQVNQEPAVLLTVLALLGLPVAFPNEAHSLAALRLIVGPDRGAFTPAQLEAQAALSRLAAAAYRPTARVARLVLAGLAGWRSSWRSEETSFPTSGTWRRGSRCCWCWPSRGLRSSCADRSRGRSRASRSRCWPRSRRCGRRAGTRTTAVRAPAP